MDNAETLYLIEFLQKTGRKKIGLYTLMTFGGEVNRPLIIQGKLIFFNEPTLAPAAWNLAPLEMRSWGPCPKEVAATYNLTELFQLIDTGERDETATIVDCLNTFDDLLSALRQPLLPEYKKLLDPLADHLTFHQELAPFLSQHQIERSDLRNAVQWCVTTIFSNSQLLSLESWRYELSWDRFYRKREVLLTKQKRKQPQTTVNVYS